MITSTNLLSYGMPNIQAYYATIAQNYLSGKIPMAREQFKALSKRQRKPFFEHLTKEWHSVSGDPIFNFFFEIL